MAGPTERAGVLVLRVWVEDSGAGLRARITEISDLESGEETSRVAASLDEIVAIVREWVEQFASAAN